MHRLFTPVLLCATFIIFPGTAYALRCGTQLANIGDLKHEVLLACGKPTSKEIIGYIDHEWGGNRIRVLIIEEWIIETSNYYYSLVFEGNTLVTIESAGRKK